MIGNKNAIGIEISARQTMEPLDAVKDVTQYKKPIQIIWLDEFLNLNQSQS